MIFKFLVPNQNVWFTMETMKEPMNLKVFKSRNLEFNSV